MQSVKGAVKQHIEQNALLVGANFSFLFAYSEALQLIRLNEPLPGRLRNTSLSLKAFH